MNEPISPKKCCNRLKTGVQLFKRSALKIKSPLWLFVLGIFIIGWVVACMMTIETHTFSQRWNQQADERHQSVMNQFGNLDSHINQIAQQTPQFNTLNRYFLSLEHTIGDMGTRLASLATHQDLQSLAAQWQALPKNTVPSEQAPSSTPSPAPLLPFTVVTLDVINEQPFLVVEFDHRIVPLSRNDAIAGWRLEDAEYDTQRITWRSPQGKKITMPLAEADFDAR